MQPFTPRRSTVRLRSALLLAAVLSLATMAMPLAFAAACSCAMLGGPEESIATADMAFVGTAVETAPGAGAPGVDIGMGTVRYAFEVERASVATDAVVEVQALDDPGGAACGFSFGMGERWLVMAHRQEGAMHTNLCSGNLLLTQLDEAELERVMSALPVTPEPAPEAASDPAPPAAILPAVIGGLAALALVGVMVIAFRGDRLR